MRRALLAVVATVAGTAWVVTYKVSPHGGGTTPVNPGDTASPAASAQPQYYTGSVQNVFYGDVQVQIVIQDGKIVQVNTLSMPFDAARSQEISQYAAPVLHDEVIQAQSANIDIVSGATYTSQGYIQSLQDALKQAGR